MEFRVKQLREDLGMSQEELSRQSGVSRPVIVKLESGEQVSVSTRTLVALASALHTPVKEIFTD